MQKKNIYVGIHREVASGKNLFLEANCLSTFDSGEVWVFISQDNYYKPGHLQPIDAQGVA